MILKVNKFVIKSKVIIFWFFLLFLFFYFRIVEINRPLWSDELITLKTLDVNPISNPLYNGVSTNLPLYYYLVKIFQIITFSGLNLRYLNIIISLVTLVFVFKNYSNKNHFLKYSLVVFLALSPIQIYYSIEIRTYALAQLLIVINYYLFKEKKFNNTFWFSCALMLLTHYSCYIYLGAIFLIAVFQKLNFKILRNFVILGFFGLFTIFLISKNSGFENSTQKSILSGDFDKFQLKFFTQNLLKLREVLSIYYNFGLHYYRIENVFLSVFKKVLQFLLVVFAAIAVIKRKSFNSSFYWLLLLFSFLMIFSILFDLAGIMPFGGRHIFPFQFFYILILSSFFEELSIKKAMIGSLLILFFVVSYLSYDFCLSQTLDIFTGNNDPQGSLFGQCVNKITQYK